MGTRHLQSVISKDGELKINQYGQWDGYPSGQGVEVLRYLRSGNLDKYQENLKHINIATEEQLKEVDKDPNWSKNYPYLSRDCGSKIHKLIEDGSVLFVQHIDAKEANMWCEGFYTIDFKNNTFTSEYGGNKSVYQLDNLPTDDEYIAVMTVDNY